MSTAVLVGAICEVAGFAAASMLVGLTVKSYGSLPERIAIHFGMRGEPNGWGSRGFALALPIIGVVMFVTLTFINPAVGLATVALGPGVSQSIIVTTIALAGNIVLLAAVERGMIAFNLGQSRSLGSPVLVVVIVFLVLAVALAFYFGALAGR
jgi:Protein of unknown function (DUF1648)